MNRESVHLASCREGDFAWPVFQAYTACHVEFEFRHHGSKEQGGGR